MKQLNIRYNRYVLVLIACLSLQVHLVGDSPDTLPTNQVSGQKTKDIFKSYKEILEGVKELEGLLSSLDHKVTRAPRPDAVTASNPSDPVSMFDSADLDAIRRCICLIKDVVGSLTDVAHCFADTVTIADVNGVTDCSIICWLKTIVLELHGFC